MRKYGLLLGIVIIGVMLFTACDNIEEPAEIKAPVKNGYGRISIILSEGETEWSARTVLPSTVFSKCTYTFSKNGAAGTEKSPGADGSFILEAGSYTVSVQAYVGNAAPYTLAAAGVSAQFNVGSGNNTAVKVPLTAVTEGEKGKFNYTVTYPAGADAEITLQKWPGMDNIALTPVNTTSENGKTQTLELDTGSYLLTVLVSKSGLYAGLVEAVHIYPVITTEYSKSFADSDLLDKIPPTTNDYTITGTGTFTYDGSEKRASITRKANAPNGAVTVFYNGEESVPVNAGTYTVTFDVAEADNCIAATGLPAGVITIEKTTPTAADFNISGLTQEYDGNPKTVSITPKVNTQGAVTVYYPNQNQNRTVIIDMYDSDDDGWNGNGALRINVNGSNITSNVKVQSTAANNTPNGQRSKNTYTFNVKIGDVVQLYWVAGISQEENSFIVYYADTLPSPAFTESNNNNWDGSNALVYKLRNTMNNISNNTLLGAFTVNALATIAPINPGTYTITFDVAATTNFNAISGLLAGTLTISKATGAKVNVPTVNGSPTSSSITVNAVSLQTATGQSIEYAISTMSNESPSKWQSDTTFTGLVSGIMYYIYARSASNTNYNKGTASTSTRIATAAAIVLPTIEMVQIPGGSFEMGNDNYNNERPVHKVTLSSFYMGKYEVTQEQWEAIMGNNPSRFNDSPEDGEVQGKRPVEQVSWYDTLVFCNKLSMKEGLSPAYRISGSTDPAFWVTLYDNYQSIGNAETWDAVEIVAGSNGYRLPTEAQWEYAARGGNGSPGNYTYSGSNNIDTVAWYGANYGNYGGNSDQMTHEVGKKIPNGLGLYDMSGNVWELCWDWYNNYSSEKQTDPMGAAAGHGRVLRGGSWNNGASYARSSVRSYVEPYDWINSDFPSTGSSYVGFRLIRP